MCYQSRLSYLCIEHSNYIKHALLIITLDISCVYMRAHPSIGMWMFISASLCLFNALNSTLLIFL